MNRRSLFFLGFLLLLTTHDPRLTTVFGAVEMPASADTKGLTWLGHAAFRLAQGGVVLYFDPWKIEGQPRDADLVLITHPHFDHLSPADVARVAKADTVIVTVEGAVSKLTQEKVVGTIRTLKPGERLEHKGVQIEAVPAYNTNKTFHLKENGWVGFIVEVEGKRFYHAGDTDFIPEMKQIKVDVACLPVSGTYVMTAEEAGKAAGAISAKVYVPMHYGSVVGTVADAKRFESLAKGKVVEIFRQEGAGGE